MPGLDRASLILLIPDLIRDLLARRSTLWTLNTIFPWILCAKVHALDLPYNGRNTLQGDSTTLRSVPAPPISQRSV
jgi:hypothetical protein